MDSAISATGMKAPMDHDRFYYNRSVTNVNITEVHNVYNTPSSIATRPASAITAAMAVSASGPLGKKNPFLANATLPGFRAKPAHSGSARQS